MSVYANGRSILHKGDGRTHIAAAPDVCKTPSPGGPVPVPYSNMAQNRALSRGSSTVKVEGNPAAIEGSTLSTSSGDEAGTAGGGVISSKIKGALSWTSNSPDVQFEGKGVVRFLDVCMHNGNTNNTGGEPAQGDPAAPAAEAKCPPHEWERLKDEDTTEERIAKAEASSQSGDRYNACVAKKLRARGSQVDISLRFKCSCGEYQEVDLLVDGCPGECKSGNQGAKKKQTLNYVDIDKKLFGGKGVTVFFESAAKAASEAKHIVKWGANAQHMPC